MATIYKIEVEIVSDWTSYPPDDIKELIKTKIEENHKNISKLRVENIKVIKTN